MKKAAVRGIAVALPSDVAAARPFPCLADTDVEGGEATGDLAGDHAPSLPVHEGRSRNTPEQLKRKTASSFQSDLATAFFKIATTAFD